MIIDHPKVLLFVEPHGPKTETPVYDELYHKVYDALARAVLQTLFEMKERKKAPGLSYGTVQDDGSFENGGGWMGSHTCSCGVSSHPHDYVLPNGYFTNLLAVHYLAWHRHEIPQKELDKVKAFVDTIPSPYISAVPADTAEEVEIDLSKPMTFKRTGKCDICGGVVNLKLKHVTKKHAGWGEINQTATIEFNIDTNNQTWLCQGCGDTSKSE